MYFLDEDRLRPNLRSLEGPTYPTSMVQHDPISRHPTLEVFYGVVDLIEFEVFGEKFDPIRIHPTRPDASRNRVIPDIPSPWPIPGRHHPNLGSPNCENLQPWYRLHGQVIPG